MEEKEQIINMFQRFMKERGVPRNIKRLVEESMEILEGDGSKEVKISSIITLLDEASNDPNLSMFARTELWNIVSFLESLKNKC